MLTHTTHPTADAATELHRRIKEMQDAAYTHGEYSQEAVRIALDGVLEEIDALFPTERAAIQPSGEPTGTASGVLTIPAAIMDIAVDHRQSDEYRRGHRDARHAAADLVLARADELAALAQPVQPVAAPDGWTEEAAKLAPILRNMCEGGDVHGDGVDIYAEDYQAGDGDIYVVRAAALLDEIAAAPAAPASAPPLPDWIAYDDKSDTLTIHGIKYAGELMRDFAGAMPIGEAFEIVRRDNGTLAVHRLTFAAPASAPVEAVSVQPDPWPFIAKVAGQKPEKPDYWSSCGQCENNASEAEELIDARALQGKPEAPKGGAA